MAEDTIFDKIIRKEVPARIRFESERVIAFDDINPREKTHMVVIPKRRVKDIQTLLSEEDKAVWMDLLHAIQEIVKQYKLEGGYYIRTNVGSFQQVPHLHIHLMSDRVIE